MDLTLIKNKTKTYLEGKWFDIVKVMIVMWAIDFVLGLIFRTSSIFSTVVDGYDIMNDGQAYPKLISTMAFFTTGNILLHLVTGFVSSAMMAGFTMTLLAGIQNDRSIHFDEVVQNIKDNLIDILIISVVSSIIYVFLTLIPLVGLIISMVVSYMFAFSYFILKDQRAHDGVEAMKMSVKDTKGIKFDLFKLNVYYYIRPFLGYLIIIVGGVFAIQNAALGILLFIVGLAVSAWLYVLYIPYAHVAVAMAYHDHKEI